MKLNFMYSFQLQGPICHHFSVARVRPRTSKGINLMLSFNLKFKRLYSKCTTTHQIKKELSICQSFWCPGLVNNFNIRYWSWNYCISSRITSVIPVSRDFSHVLAQEWKFVPINPQLTHMFLCEYI